MNDRGTKTAARFDRIKGKIKDRKVSSLLLFFEVVHSFFTSVTEMEKKIINE